MVFKTIMLPIITACLLVYIGVNTMGYFDLFNHMKWYHGAIAGALLADAGWRMGHSFGGAVIDKFWHMIKSN